MLGLLIANGTVIDGAGGPRRRLDVGVSGDRIVAVERLAGATALATIDATGRIVAPGFIDPHSHSDFTLLANPLFHSTIRQGVTTEIVGNCGLGCAPLTEHSRARTASRLAEYAYTGPVQWASFASYLEAIEDLGTSANTAWLVGHNALRDAAGVSGSDPDEADIRQMQRFVAEAMDAGAFGMSSGLEFEPGRLAAKPELERLASVVGARNGIYASHIRNRDTALGAAIDEFLAVTRSAGAMGQVSHLNVRHNTGAPTGAWEDAVAAVERARDGGLDVMADATPMTSGDGVAAALLPPWLTAGGPGEAARRLRDPAVRERLRTDCDRYWRFVHRGEWHRVRLLSSNEYPELAGLTFPEIADALGVDEWDAYFQIMAAAGEGLETVAMVGELFTEELSAATVAHPLFLLGADTMTTTVDGPLSRHTRHPLHYAAHVHYLTHHVRERGTLSLEEAIQKMTALVASRFGIPDRGVLRPGAYADIVVFDFERLDDVSTVQQPLAYVSGVEHVVVNGIPVTRAGEHLGTRPGRVLRRN